MQKSILFIFSIFISFVALSQSGTLQYRGGSLNDQASILIIPNEPFMYISEIDRAIGEKNNLNGDQLREKFAIAVDKYLYGEFSKKYNVLSFYLMDDEDIEQDLTYIYTSRKLKYVDNPKATAVIEDGEIKDKLSKAFKKPNRDNKDNYGGQLVVKDAPKDRFMDIEITNENLLDSLNKQFKAEVFLFVNQLEFRNLYEIYSKMEREEYQREIKVHYTLLTLDGDVLSKGISSSLFPASENDIDIITKSYFPILAKNIYNDIHTDLTSSENN